MKTHCLRRSLFVVLNVLTCLRERSVLAETRIAYRDDLLQRSGPQAESRSTLNQLGQVASLILLKRSSIISPRPQKQNGKHIAVALKRQWVSAVLEILKRCLAEGVSSCVRLNWVDKTSRQNNPQTHILKEIVHKIKSRSQSVYLKWPLSTCFNTIQVLAGVSRVCECSLGHDMGYSKRYKWIKLLWSSPYSTVQKS